jgi:DNA modification methylase
VDASRIVDTNILYCDDNWHRLAQFPDACVDLIYLDPPFFSNRNYEVIWGDEAEVRSFEDRWEGGINVYVNWMRERVIEMYRVLKPTGSLYLHCDWHAGHYLKMMLDDLFGMDKFRNEIIWYYKTGGMSKRWFGRKHDTIFLYSKGDNYTFNPMKEKSYLAHRYGFSNIEIFEDEGGPYTMVGVRDVWDIPALRGNQPEALGYPTQKPITLLERIIQASSNPGDIILDPFCGCGTTVAAAQNMGREWIGIDISPTAVNLIRRRVEKEGAVDVNGASTVKIMGLPVTEEELKALKPFEFQNWVIQRFNGTHSPRKSGDMGIDGYSFLEHHPIQVKRSERVGRNTVDNFETAIERDSRDKGYIVAFSFTRDAREEVARAKSAKGMEIQLVKVSGLLEETADIATLTTLFAEDQPLPPVRSKETRPSVEDLVESEKVEQG